MKIYKRLYTGLKANNDRRTILHNLERKKLQIGVYVITLPKTGSNLLEIHPAFFLKYSFFRDKRNELYVVGIARGRTEALELAGKIAMDTYNATGGFDVADFLLRQ